jgi:dehydrogenase/reductase SDR family member 7B
MHFNNKTVLVTGASQGIGASIARAFANEGAQVILSARNVHALEEVKNSCSNPEKHIIIPLDLEAHTSFPKVVSEVLSKVNHIDVLVNNAGLSQRSLAMETSYEVDKKLLDINLLGTIALTKAVLPNMIQYGGGHIVTISSLAGKFATPKRSAYSAAKHGLYGFFDALRAELYDKNIKVLMVAPGFIQTNISVNAITGDGSLQQTMDKATAEGVKPEKVANAILNAIKSGKSDIAVGGEEVLGIYIKRFFPALMRSIIRKAKVV